MQVPWISKISKQALILSSFLKHILFVNGQYAGNDAIGDLMHDFRCNNAGDMKNPLFAKGMRYRKESKEGVEKCVM